MSNKLNTHRIYVLYMTALIFFSVSSLSVYAEDKDLFVGAWDMLKFETLNDDGVWTEVVISDTELVGNIVFTASGIMQVQMFSSDRNNAELNDNNAEIVNGYSAYFANYEVNDVDKIVTYNRIGHMVERFAKEIVNRKYDFKGDIMYIYNSDKARMNWKRIRP
ncbi:MAG: hypothetical protein HOM01_01690 [Kordiimonadaceae bacterium]|jgi:hypothetical protein|nr:hypothetical protein [Kordiimonadaceae bacterium]